MKMEEYIVGSILDHQKDILREILNMHESIIKKLEIIEHEIKRLKKSP